MAAETGTGKYEQLLARCAKLAPVVTAVVHPCEHSALAGPVEAAALEKLLALITVRHRSVERQEARHDA